MASINLKEIVKCYVKDVRVIKNINLKIDDGEFAVIVGPSGCGKSTLLRMVAGIEEVTEGNIFIDNENVTTLAPKDRNISMVFQNYALYPQMNVHENMSFGLKMRRDKKSIIDKKVKWAAEKLELTDLLGRRPKELSGGQKQRVALGRAIVREPKVFLFDEPLSNLDAKLRVQMRSEIKKLHEEFRTTMIYVTHDQVEAMTLGSKIIVLKEGVIHQVDTPLNLYRYPADTFVGKFIGNPGINLITCDIDKNFEMIFETGEKLSFSSEQQFQIDLLKKYNNNKIILGIRPEFVSITKNKNGAFLEGRLKLIEPLGNETLYHFKIGDTEIISREHGGEVIDNGIGDKVQFSLDLNNACFFDFDSKKNLSL